MIEGELAGEGERKRGEQAVYLATRHELDKMGLWEREGEKWTGSLTLTYANILRVTLVIVVVVVVSDGRALSFARPVLSSAGQLR